MPRPDNLWRLSGRTERLNDARLGEGRHMLAVWVLVSV
jgi:hypothetical protein